MVEVLEVYDLKDKYLGDETRKKIYSEMKKEFDKVGKISRKVKSIRVIIMNSKGRIYLQKRSKLKDENPGLYDKTIGGHVPKGDTWDLTTVRECAEELGFPASIVSPDEFEKAIRITDLNIVGILTKIDYISNFQSVRVTKERTRFIQPFMSSIYVGYYDGPMKFVDGESSGIEVFSLKELKEDIKKHPKKFTEDLRFLISRYEKYFKPA